MGSFILFTTFIAILTSGFHRTRSVVQQQSNDFEVIDYMWRSLKLSLGFSGSGDRGPTVDRSLAESSTGEIEVVAKMVKRATLLHLSKVSERDAILRLGELESKAQQMSDLVSTLIN